MQEVRMNVHIKLVQYNQDNPDGIVLVETDGSFEQQSLFYQEGPQIHHEITFLEDGLRIKRKADVTSTTSLLSEGYGTSKVESPYGMMELQTKLLQYLYEEGMCEVEYELLEAGDSLGTQRFIWTWEGKENERN